MLLVKRSRSSGVPSSFEQGGVSPWSEFQDIEFRVQRHHLDPAGVQVLSAANQTSESNFGK
jgi:hypothetical protein